MKALFFRIFGYLYAHFGALSKEKRLAKKEFKEAFVETILCLNEMGQSDRLILHQYFPAQRLAYHRYRIQLPERLRVSLDRNWEEYEKHYQERVKVDVFEFFAAEATDPNRMNDPAHYADVKRKRCRHALELIDNLIE